MQRFTSSIGSAFGALALLGLTALAAQAQTTSGTTAPTPGNSPTAANYTPKFPHGIWELSHENDWFIYSDRDYTGGLRLAYTTPNYRDWSQVPLVPGAYGQFFNNISLINDDWATVAAAAYAQINIYTPDDQKINPPNPNDYPYSGWVGMGTDLIRQTSDRRAIFEVNLGLIGPESGAAQLQDSFHSSIGDSQPAGWDHQLKDEPVLQLTYRQDWRIPGLTNLNPSVRQTWGYDVIGHGLATVGNGWDYAATGAQVRYGYHLPLDFGPSRMRLGDVSTMPYVPGGTMPSTAGWSLDSLSAYVTFGAEGRAIARDITLDGNTWARSASVSKEPLVAEIYGGLTVEYGNFRGSFLVLYETNTFRAQPSNQGQWRGILTLGYSF